MEKVIIIGGGIGGLCVAVRLLNEGYDVTILEKEDRFNMFQWIDKLEYWLLGLPKPDMTIFLHMPYEYSLKLKSNREFLDEHEKSEEHLKHAESCYKELQELYNWEYINCIKNNEIRTIEDISEEVLEKVLNMKKDIQ